MRMQTISVFPVLHDDAVCCRNILPAQTPADLHRKICFLHNSYRQVLYYKEPAQSHHHKWSLSLSSSYAAQRRSVR